VRVNCATLQNDTIESELFGHERGAFTGADKSKIGLFESAHGGWIFLDEVAKLSTRAQASLLRTLETGEIRPLGSNQTKTVQVRVLAATNEDLDHLAQTGMFRQDLLERLRAYTIELPPLRQRSLTERSELLAHLLERLAHAMKVQSPFKLDAAAHKMILAAPFRKSNIREMWNVLQSAAVDAQDGCITVACLPKSFLAEQCDGVHQHGEVHGTDVPLGGSRGELLCAKHGPFVVGDFPGDPSLSEVAEGLKRLGYEGYEMHFFATVLQRLVHEAPEHTRSIRSLANKLRMGRHLVTRKVLALRDLGMLPHGLGHLFSFGVGKQHGIPNSEQSVEESN
jgi:DNA-binding NtrC family response regulator